MLNFFLLILLLIKISIAFNAPSTKTLFWPNQFKQQFITPTGKFQSFGTLYFDDTLKTTRIDHSPGSIECFK
jgi:hypothetical protein